MFHIFSQPTCIPSPKLYVAYKIKGLVWECSHSRIQLHPGRICFYKDLFLTYSCASTGDTFNVFSLIPLIPLFHRYHLTPLPDYNDRLTVLQDGTSPTLNQARIRFFPGNNALGG